MICDRIVASLRQLFYCQVIFFNFNDFVYHRTNWFVPRWDKSTPSPGPSFVTASWDSNGNDEKKSRRYKTGDDGDVGAETFGDRRAPAVDTIRPPASFLTTAECLSCFAHGWRGHHSFGPECSASKQSKRVIIQTCSSLLKSHSPLRTLLWMPSRMRFRLNSRVQPGFSRSFRRA